MANDDIILLQYMLTYIIKSHIIAHEVDVCNSWLCRVEVEKRTNLFDLYNWK